MNDVWLGLARHLMTLLGGIAVTKGWVDESAATQLVGIGVSLTGVTLSVMDKQKRR